MKLYMMIVISYYKSSVAGAIKRAMCIVQCLIYVDWKFTSGRIGHTENIRTKTEESNTAWNREYMVV